MSSGAPPSPSAHHPTEASREARPAPFRNPLTSHFPAPDRDRARRRTGFVLWMLGIVVGLVLNVFFTYAEIRWSSAPGASDRLVLGAMLAFLPLGVYLFVPAIVDRYDPEPWWCLGMAFLWGAITATGFAGMINTWVGAESRHLVGKESAELITSVVSAPLSEELWKGLCVLGFFWFLRREFDGVVDGIIYATFCALGFAAVENVAYYARAAAEGDKVLTGTVLLRGVLAPWGHPFYTSMTGIGFGVARESSRGWVKVVAPIAGSCVAVLLHATWNFVPTAFGRRVFAASLVLWLVFVSIFFCIIVGLVVRKGRIIRRYLRDEVVMGNLTAEELELVCSPVGRLKATFSWRGATGRSLIRAAAGRALSMWHVSRAHRGNMRTLRVSVAAPRRGGGRRGRAGRAARAPAARR